MNRGWPDFSSSCFVSSCVKQLAILLSRYGYLQNECLCHKMLNNRHLYYIILNFLASLNILTVLTKVNDIVLTTKYTNLYHTSFSMASKPFWIKSKVYNLAFMDHNDLVTKHLLMDLLHQ